MWEKHQVMHPSDPIGIHQRIKKMAVWSLSRLWKVSDPTLFQMTLVAALFSTVLGRCGVPPNLYFASPINELNQTSFSSGTVLKYTCRPGYSRAPYKSHSLTCQHNSWNYDEFCVKKRCRHPGELQNGQVVVKTDILFGSRIEFTCSEGYVLIGSTTSFCEIQDRGVDWSDPLPQCIIAKCEPPPPISNGRHNGGDEDFYIYGSSVTYSCDPNFSLLGKASIFCTVEDNKIGIWSPSPPTCKKVSCSKPEIENGKIILGFGPLYTYKDSMVFDCDRGFILNGSSLIHCEEDNNWDPPPPTCELNSCVGLPDIPNASWETYNHHLSTNQRIYTIGTALRYRCRDGYKPTSDEPTTVTCQENLTWTPHIECKEVCCPIPRLKNNGEITARKTSAVNSCDYFKGDEISYTCYKKYNFKARCQADGTWYPKTPTCDENCDFPPTIAHGNYERQTYGIFSSTEVIYKCDEGYTLVGEARLSCRSSRWSHAPPQCKALCPKPEIAHGKLSVDKTQYVESENVAIHCDSGYMLVGPESITCLYSKIWYPEVPRCEWVIPEGCENVLAGRKIMQCLPNPQDVKMALEVYKLFLEIKLLEIQTKQEILSTEDHNVSLKRKAAMLTTIPPMQSP
ncbi:C4b-binding protein alpha chain-like isoform X2 [Suricata suricatta]|uniref:C4b-binding protein alpha chain-like isoform X2 n=1 Tax=Suricata suricatta TaxID=37032 RepID=UPI00115582F1|nr:C4b-binding protein alpha chain-like isoform X2 [Suricata suricatta]